MVTAIGINPTQGKPENWFDKATPAGAGSSKLSRLARDVIAVISKFFAKIPEQLSKIGEIVGSCKAVLGIFDLAVEIKYWICDFSPKTNRWQKTANKVATTAIAVFNAMSFLKLAKIANCEVLFGTIKHVPVFGTLLSAAYMFAGIFGSWNGGIELRSAIAKVKEIEKKSALISDELKKVPVNDRVKKVALEARITHLTKELVEAKSTRTKCWITIAYSVANLAFSILCTIGLISGIAALSMTGVPLLAVGAVLSGFALFKFIYDQAHPKKEIPPFNPNLAAAAA